MSRGCSGNPEHGAANAPVNLFPLKEDIGIMPAAGIEAGMAILRNPINPCRTFSIRARKYGGDMGIV